MKFGKVPLLIGLIGHRELSPIEEPKLQMIFDEYIEMYLTKYENSQIVVLSSLAEGADRLVFSSRYRPKIKIIAVLPFSVDEYRKDFKSTEERKNFEAVLSDCDDVVILEGELRNEELADLEGRSRGYAQAGAWMIEHCQLLLAIWDGKYIGKTGGTGETVRSLVGLKNPPQLIHIQASNNTSASVQSCDCGGHLSPRSSVEESLEKQNVFNRLITQDADSVFQLIDDVATRMRRKYDRRVKISLVFGLILINAISIEQSVGKPPWLTVVSMAAVVTTSYWYRLKRSKVKELYEDFRVVAESLRVEALLRDSGIKGDSFKNIGIDELVDPWLAGLMVDLRKWESLTGAVSGKKIDTQIDWGNVINWLDDQIDYLDGTQAKQGAIGRNLHKAKSYDRLAKASIFTAISIYISSKLIQYFWPTVIQSELRTLLAILFSAALSCSAFSLALSQLMGYKEIAARYGASLRVLKNGRAMLAQNLAAGDIQMSQQVVKQIGLESLQETLYWFTVRRTRDVRPL